MIEQVTVFLENSEGRLAALCRCLGDAGVDMSALTISDTEEYGLVRIITREPKKALKALDDGGFRATSTMVSAIELPNRPGALADLLDVLNKLDLNIEYGYCFSTSGGRAVDALKIHGATKAAEAAMAIEEAGFKLLEQDEV